MSGDIKHSIYLNPSNIQNCKHNDRITAINRLKQEKLEQERKEQLEWQAKMQLQKEEAKQRRETIKTNDVISKQSRNSHASYTHKIIKNDDVSADSSLSLLITHEYKCKYCNYRANNEIMIQSQCDILHASLILDNLYLSSKLACNDYEFIKYFNIRVIFNITCDVPLDKQISKQLKWFERVRMNDKVFEKSGLQGKLIDILPKMRKYIECGYNVLVHCNQGVSRSSTFVIAYLMWYYHISYQRAKTLVKERRSIIEPNYGFEEILTKFNHRAVFRNGEIPQLGKSFTDAGIAQFNQNCEKYSCTLFGNANLS